MFTSAKEDVLIQPQIEITLNKTAVLEGACGIIEYTDELIRVNFANYEVKFYGTHLVIDNLSQDTLEIRGNIERLEYC